LSSRDVVLSVDELLDDSTGRVVGRVTSLTSSGAFPDTIEA